ncbi:hypothetical protein D3C71_75300 [compost metagenome]
MLNFMFEKNLTTMKKLLFFISIFSSTFFFSQINMSVATHFYNPYQMNIQGNGTIYYTTDGTTPTLSSSSAVNSVNILIDQNKEIKAFLVSSTGNTSAVFTKKYFTGAIPDAHIFFKPPSGWTNGACVRVEMINPNSIDGFVIDNLGSGYSMNNTGCDGWYKITKSFETANVSFTNCYLYQNFPGNIDTPLIPMGSSIYYDFSSGVITNPPSCLLGTKDVKHKDVTLVKVYPNPVAEILQINTDKNFVMYEILEGTGRVISKEKFSKSIPVNHLSSGNYFVKLIDNKHDFVFVKFIKK